MTQSVQVLVTRCTELCCCMYQVSLYSANEAANRDLSNVIAISLLRICVLSIWHSAAVPTQTNISTVTAQHISSKSCAYNITWQTSCLCLFVRRDSPVVMLCVSLWDSLVVISLCETALLSCHVSVCKTALLSCCVSVCLSDSLCISLYTDSQLCRHRRLLMKDNLSSVTHTAATDEFCEKTWTADRIVETETVND